MKKIHRASLALALCLLLTLTFFTHVSADETEVIDYAALFAQAQSISPETTQDFIADLNDAFAANRIAFLDALSDTDENTVSTIVFHWITGKTLNDIYELRDFVNESSEGSEYYLIVSALNQEIGVREYALAMEPYMQYEDPEAPFSVAIIKRFIDLNIAHETFDTDEEFNHIMALAYEASPTHFAEAISTYSQAEIVSLAKCVSADYAKLGKTAPAVTYDLTSTKNQYIINLIQSEITNAMNPQLQTESISLAPPTVEILSTCIPTIGTMTYTTAPLEVGQTEVLNIVFSESTQVSSLRQWYVEIFQVVDNVYIRKKAATVSISPGATSAAINFTLSFPSASTFYTHVKVYSMEGGSQLARRTGTYPDTVSPYWYIYINLPADRSEYGTLRLYDAYGQIYCNTVCLGKSVSGDPQNIYYGNTPTGIYVGYLGPKQSDEDAYGPYQVIMMDGIAGNIYKYRDIRSQIWIHGGRTQDVLAPTNGCVRVFENDQKTLQDKIIYMDSSYGHEARGFIYISDPYESYS